MAGSINLVNLKKTYYYLKRNGVMPTIGAALERVQAPYFADYKYELPPAETLEKQKKTVWEQPVTFSVVVPAYETKEVFLQVLIDSLLEQTYPYWELIIADASSSDKVEKECEKYSCSIESQKENAEESIAGDIRIRYIRLQNNAGISENTNQGIVAATGDYIGLLDHDDYLTPDALYEMAMAIKKGKEAGQEYGFLYSDEDKCDETGKIFYDPHIKTDFNLDLFLTNNYICHFCVMKADLMKELAFRKEYDGAQDYDLCLRAVANLWKTNPKVEDTIWHIPKVLYHWRCHNDSTAANPQSKRYAYDAGKRALQDFVNKQGWKASVEEMPHVGFYKVIYEGSVFAQREDVAAIGYKQIRGGKVISGAYDEKGNMLYEGLPFCYSGYIHRAVLSQNVAGLDMDTWVVNPGLEEEVASLIKKQEAMMEEAGAKSGKKEKRRAQLLKIAKQKAVCKELLSQGYRLYWNPHTK